MTPKRFSSDDEELIALLRYGLARAIQIHSEEVRAKRPTFSLDLDLVDDEGLLGRSECLLLFMVYQEALENALRHAPDGQMKVRYYPNGEMMALALRDAGEGFSITADWAEFTVGHASVVGMKDSIEAQGGSLSLSKDEEGTIILASVPIRKA